MTDDWQHLLERTVIIRARPTTVFRYFTDSERFAAWWGDGSEIEGRPGGRLRIRYPNGVIAGGEVVEIVPDQRVVFTYGYEDPTKGIPLGGSRVIVTLEPHPEGTLVRLAHELADAATRDAHVAGWRFQLSLFANVVTREEHAGVATVVDRYFALWTEADPQARAKALAHTVDDGVVFRDAFATLEGQAELALHIAAAREHMPGVHLAPEGSPVQCQGTALVDWIARGPDGMPRGRGTNLFDLAADGRIKRIVGFWRG